MVKRIVVVGVPGVGKTTVVTEAIGLLKEQGLKAEVAVYGTFMLDEARKLGIKHRDNMRKLAIDVQREIQAKAVRAIREINADMVLIDTHAYIRTRSGLWPGLPKHILDVLQPDLFVIVEAAPEEIIQRRSKDADRKRDSINIDEVRMELAMTRASIASASVLTGAPLAVVMNRAGMPLQAAKEMVNALGGL